jgi:maltooligosyltrehalose trehalohydrolase
MKSDLSELVGAVAPTTARRCGAALTRTGTRFRVWAPKAKRLDLVLINGDKRRTIAMTPGEDGHFAHDAPGVGAGQRYAFQLDGGPDRADPCSLYQPEGPAGPSEVFAPESFAWTDGDWKGVERRDLVIYEMHVGTFTDAGTFDAAIERLDDLVDLGVTAIEVMPNAQWSGPRNCGYDGVLPYAAQNTHGGPAAFQRFVDAAHAKGLGVILDVVYNHFGPEHNYFREFGPYFTHKYNTPWGDAINFDDRDSDNVRDFVLDNARIWLDAFHCDGLRLDAVHAIFDLGANHILMRIQEVAEDVASETGLPKTIIAESDMSDPRILEERERGGYAIGAQWADDLHHAIHTMITGERRGYYADFGEATHIVEAYNTPFVGAGKFSGTRGRKHGRKPEGLGGDRFIVCIQNHDQVGNRAIGDRLSAIMADDKTHGHAKQRLAACLYLLSPYLPMLWMGEEYGEERPFPFFCSFEGKELADAVRKGRAGEFKDFIDEHHQVPDPLAQETFDSAKLSWHWPDGSPNAGLRQLYKDLIAAGKSWPALRDLEHREARLLDHRGSVIELVRGTGDAQVRCLFNLTDREQPLPAGAGQAAFDSESKRYAGRRDGAPTKALLPFECIVFGPATSKPLRD